MNRAWYLVLRIFLFSCEKIADNGNKFHHQKLMISFPKEIYDFKRIEIIKFDKSGLDISAGYFFRDKNEGNVSATIYVYPAPKLTSFGSPQNVIDRARKKLTNDHFLLVKKSIEQQYPTYAVVDEKETFENFRGKMRYCKTTKYDDKSRVVAKGQKNQYSMVELCSVDEWLIKFRVTYQSNKMGGKVDSFKKEFFSTNSL